LQTGPSDVRTPDFGSLPASAERSPVADSPPRLDPMRFLRHFRHPFASRHSGFAIAGWGIAGAVIVTTLFVRQPAKPGREPDRLGTRVPHQLGPHHRNALRGFGAGSHQYGPDYGMELLPRRVACLWSVRLCPETCEDHSVAAIAQESACWTNWHGRFRNHRKGPPRRRFPRARRTPRWLPPLTASLGERHLRGSRVALDAAYASVAAVVHPDRGAR